jgi:hypothetical protein
MCKFISSAGGVMPSFRFVMIHNDPAATMITMSTPNASASTLLVLSGPVVMCRKKTNGEWAISHIRPRLPAVHFLSGKAYAIRASPGGVIMK